MLLEKLLPPELLDEDDPPPDLLGILLEKLFWLPELLDDDAFDLLGMLFEKPLPLAELFEEEDPLDLVGILFEKLLGSDFEGFEGLLSW